MTRLQILPLTQPIKAEVSVPGSKSYTIRALLIAALTPGSVKIINPLLSDDTRAMMNCLSALGVKIVRQPDFIEVVGNISDVQEGDYDLDADLSGITIRFMLALLCLVPGRKILHGKPPLHKRPIGALVTALTQLGADIEYLDKTGYPPLQITSSTLTGGNISIDGSESSQYLSALLMIAPLVDKLTFSVTGRLSSRPFIDMTLEIMRAFGVEVAVKDQHYTIAPHQGYRAAEYVVEGDVSSASYFFAIAALTESTITVTNLNPHSRQADMGFLKILEQMGNKVTPGKHEITVSGRGVRPISVDMQDCPDQAPTLAVLAAFADGVTTISGVQSLRIKETERIVALEQELLKMGIQTSSTADTLVVHGGQPRPATIATYGDHRIAMSFAVAGTILPGMVMEDPGVVSKTFPDFWKKLTEIGVSSEPVEPNIVLIGMRGSGKTTVAKLLATKLDIENLDLDEIITQKLGLSTADIVQQHGWEYFRDQEALAAEEVSLQNNKLISTGGGIVLNPNNIAALKRNGIVVFLNASVDTLLNRLGDSYERPPLTDEANPRAEVKRVLKDRQSLYKSAADIIINTDGLTAEQVVDQILVEPKRENV
jgi:3-phosphoshikimate 1-carboxyvinyltransferase